MLKIGEGRSECKDCYTFFIFFIFRGFFFTYFLADFSYFWGYFRGKKWIFPEVLKKGSSIGKKWIVFSLHSPENRGGSDPSVTNVTLFLFFKWRLPLLVRVWVLWNALACYLWITTATISFGLGNKVWGVLK